MFIYCSLEARLHKNMQRNIFRRRSRIFQKKVRATLEYVLHDANVLSGELAKPRRRPKVLQKMHPVRSQGALIVLQQPLLFSEGTHPLREGACRKKHISSERRWSMGCIVREGVRRNALRVLCPKSPHSEESAQHIEWRTPRGYAAVWLQGNAVQGRHDRLWSVILHQRCCCF